MAICLSQPLENIQKGETMSLLQEAYEKFNVINTAVVDDGYGGITTEYTEGATIQGDSSSYTLTVEKHINLDFHTILKRAKDGSYYRLTSGSDDKNTPESATLNMRQYTAERWQKP